MNERKRDQCAICPVRITRPRTGTPIDAYCSGICEDSSDAEVRRQLERHGLAT